MSELPEATANREPLSRADRRQRTRAALVHAARMVFSEVGYHRATLEEIARGAGYSKGAVYSNFDNKAELFLAVFDDNLRQSLTESAGSTNGQSEPSDGADVAAAIRGFGLATLEFIASAAREESLREPLRERMADAIRAYAAGIEADRAADDPLPLEDVAAVVFALIQGSDLLGLSGAPIAEPTMGVAVERLLTPSSGRGERGLGVLELQSRIAEWVRRDYLAGDDESGR